MSPQPNQYRIAGKSYSQAQMLTANADDQDVCEWIKSAKPGDVYEQMHAETSPASRADQMLAATLGSMKFVPDFGGPRIPKQSKPVPMMVTASREEIAAWNAKVEAKKPPKPSKHHRNYRSDHGQHPKFAKERTHKQATHPLRDKNGAYTLTGAAGPGHVDRDGNGLEGSRRKWLGDISAQRGY